MENLLDRIEINSSIMLGKPVIKGTRITVESIIEKLASDYTKNEILLAYPNITEADILAAYQYVSAIMKNEKIYLTAQ